MSHFTTLETQWVEEVPLQTALKDLGYTVIEGPTTVQDYNRTTRHVAFAATRPGWRYAIGFQRGASGWEMVADWDQLGQQQNRHQFEQQVTARYAYHIVMDQLRDQAFHLASEEQEADGTLRLVLRRSESTTPP